MAVFLFILLRDVYFCGVVIPPADRLSPRPYSLLFLDMLGMRLDSGIMLKNV